VVAVMSSVELIGKLMAGVASVGTVRGTAGAVLSKSELAGLLAGLSQAETDLAIAKYGCDDGAKRRLLVHVQAYVTALAVKEAWNPRNRELLGMLALLSVSEVVSDNLCPHCHGTGMIRVKVCNVCNGTRHKPLSGRKIAESIGVSNTQWLRDWKLRYNRIYDYVHGLDVNVKWRLISADKVKT
jgi:hypothetical protein